MRLRYVPYAGGWYEPNGGPGTYASAQSPAVASRSSDTKPRIFGLAAPIATEPKSSFMSPQMMHVASWLG